MEKLIASLTGSQGNKSQIDPTIGLTNVSGTRPQTVKTLPTNNTTDSGASNALIKALMALGMGA